MERLMLNIGHKVRCHSSVTPLSFPFSANLNILPHLGKFRKSTTNDSPFARIHLHGKAHVSQRTLCRVAALDKARMELHRS